MSQLFTGAAVALITPFTTDNQVDYKSLETIVEKQVKGGMDYLVAIWLPLELLPKRPHCPVLKKQTLWNSLRKNRKGYPLWLVWEETIPVQF